MMLAAAAMAGTDVCRVRKITDPDMSAVRVADLRTERMTDPMSIDTPVPRLGWRILSAKNDVVQTSYHIIVASTREKALNGEGDLWDCEVGSDQSQWITYGGRELRSDTRCYWRVKINTTQGESDWSDVAMWNVGLLSESDWRGQWIGLDHAMPWEVEDVHSRLGARYLRSEFDTEGEIKRATLYISGLGLYEAYINGQRVGDRVLAPPPTDYRRTVIYDAYDVTGLIAGDNAVAVAVGNGRYYTMQQNKKPYKITNFGYPKLRLNLVIEYADGKKKTVSTDGKWKLSADGAIRSDNEYDGEIYDARKEFDGWTMPGYDDSAWQTAERVAIPYGTLRGNMSPGMTVLKEIEPKSVTPISVSDARQSVVVDLGQNIAGWLKVKIPDVEAGDTVRIRYAEKINDDGSLWRDNLRHAYSTDYYIADGTEQGRWWQPAFTYHGFRYAEISILPADATKEKTPDSHLSTLNSLTESPIRLPEQELSTLNYIGCVVSDEMEPTGMFECADTVLNKIYRNATWGVLANYKGMPVDCPQRDERQPWLGDRTRGSFGEAFLFNNNALYDKWARDICEAQREDGCIPDVAPAYWNYYSDNITWPAALPFALEMMYLQYGDEAPIRKYYGNVKRWMEHMRYQYARDGLMPRDKYGDWCVPPEEQTMIHSKDPARQTDGTLIATAYYYRLNKLMARFASLTGNDDDAVAFDFEAAAVKKAFNDRFLTVNPGTSIVPGHPLYPDSTFYGNNTVTSNLLPLAFGMIDDEYTKKEVEKNIVRNIITDNKGQISCGVIGVQWLMHGLTDMGRTDVAWLLATNKKYPGWGYMTEKGATTIWELWNGDTADPAMNSGNHVMLLGDLLSWLYEDIAGIQSDCGNPGFKHIIMRPDFNTDEVDDINASYRSIYGDIVSRWKKTGGTLTWHVEIPANTTASLYMPDGTVREIGSGTHDLTCDIPWRGYASPMNNGLQPTYDGLQPPLSNRISDSLAGARTLNSQLSTLNSQLSTLNSQLPIEADEFLYTSSGFPECHSATIAETTDGDLVATYFGGTKERNPDVCIWVSRKEKGSDTWTAPQLVADGVMNDSLRKACWNPVVWQIPDGDLVIWFKIGSSVSDWSGWMISSKDGGRTWSGRQPLQEGFLGPVKNKPVMVDGRLIAPTSIEKKGWWLYFEYSDDMGQTWQRTDLVEADSGVLAIQPAILTLPDGRLEAVARTRNRQVAVTYSDDNGLTWSRLQLIDLPNNNSGLDALTLADGRYAMICNDWPIEPDKQKGARTPLSLMISDDGLHWQHALTVEDSPVSQYSYPSMIQTRDGKIHLIYTWRRQRIKHVVIDIDRL